MFKQCIVCDKPMQNKQPWLWHCGYCGFLRSNLTPGKQNTVEGLAELRTHNFKKILSRMAHFGPLADKSLLEVGCAHGWFLEQAKPYNMKLVGIESDHERALPAIEQGFDILEGFFPEIIAETEQQFDFIIFNDVFEHLADPDAALSAINTLLKPGGILILNLPSSQGIFYRLSKILAKLGAPGKLHRLWQMGFASPHLSYFNPKNLQTICRHVPRALKFC